LIPRISFAGRAPSGIDHLTDKHVEDLLATRLDAATTMINPCSPDRQSFASYHNFAPLRSGASGPFFVVPLF